MTDDLVSVTREVRRFRVVNEEQSEERGLLIFSDDPFVSCEGCGEHCHNAYAATWMQGEVGDDPNDGDVMVQAECLPCFFAADWAVKIIIDSQSYHERREVPRDQVATFSWPY